MYGAKTPERPAEHRRRRAGREATVAAAALSVGLLAYFGVAGGTPAAARVGAITWFVAAATGAVTAALAARVRTGRARLTWALIALASVAWAAGDVAWYVNRFLRHTDAFPSLSDAFWVWAAPCALAGILVYPTATLSAAGRARAALDGLVVGAALLFLSWPLVLGPILQQSGLPAFTIAVSLWYPAGDVVVLSVLAAVLTQGTRGKGAFLVLASGLALYAVADTLWGYQILNGEYSPGTGTDALYGIAPLWVALAGFRAFLRPDRAPPSPEGRPLLAGPLLPYALLFLIGVGVAVARPRFLSNPALAWLGAVVFTLVVLRQVAVTLENWRLRCALERDVEERTAEAAGLQRTRDLILDAAADGILGLDTDGRITFANRVALDLLDTHDARGRTFHDVAGHRLTTGDLCTGEDCKVTTALSGLPTHSEPGEVFEGASGTQRSVEYAATPIVREGRPVGAVVVFRDVTERAKVDRMKDELVSVVSHELRTPLTSIRGSLSLLASGRLGELEGQAAELVDIAASSSERLARLVDDILDLARLESGTLELNLEACDVVQLVAEAARAMWSQASERGVELVATGEPLILPEADFDRIQQVLTNLVGNAVKFSEPGGEVRVSVAAEGHEAVFEVKDHGVGIPPQHIEAVFERFHQVDATTRRSTGGTGLGLAICRNIVDLHGGRIWAESVPGKGSKLSFALPLSRRHEATYGLRHSPAVGAGVTAAVAAGSGRTGERP